MYKDSLYNNANDFTWICMGEYNSPLAKVVNNLNYNLYLKRLRPNQKNKFVELKKFFSQKNSMNFNNILNFDNPNIFVRTKKSYVIFYTFSCDCHLNRLGTSITHGNFLEFALYPIWKGRFLIPFQIVKSI